MFQLHPLLWLLQIRFLNIYFENLAFRLPWPPIKISNLDKICMVGRVLLQEHFCKTFVKISAVLNTEINANFHFSHYKPIKTSSCYSNESNIKHNLCSGCCHEHVCKVSASSPIWLLRRRFFNVFFFLKNLAFRLLWPLAPTHHFLGCHYWTHKA